MAKKDLFDDSTMTFGEHLEALRIHLWRAIVGLVIGTVAAFFFSDHIIRAIQKPVVAAMNDVFSTAPEGKIEKSQWESVKDWFGRTFRKSDAADAKNPADGAAQPVDPGMILKIDTRTVARQLHELAPETYPLPPEGVAAPPILVELTGTPFGNALDEMKKASMNPRTDGPDEAFMIYLKVSLIVGLIVSSPWIFYQLWLFIGAGLYSHERKYVYTYLPMSIFLFLGGAAFCFFGVIPFVLKFLFEFNKWLEIRPEIKISTWITFALVVSLMFGISFQLPLVMLFLERIGLVNVKLYREKRRHAILIIAFLSMVLTPSDPVSMMMMMLPLCLLYELGILLCVWRGVEKKSPFEALPA